jgi:hypothetical protein
MNRPRRIRTTAERLRDQAAAPNGKHRRRVVDPYPEAQRGDAWPGDQAAGDLPEPELPGVLLSTVRPSLVTWLWPGRLPRGKLTILDGDPGLGKSVLTLGLAAAVTRGWAMPLEPREAGDELEVRAVAGVVLLNAEDGLADTVLPRLLAAGGDAERVWALTALPDGKAERPPVLPGDLQYLALCVRRMEAALVIIDPLMAYLGGDVNAHRDQDVRRALHPLAQLAQKTGAAVLVVRHLNKGGPAGNPLYRGGGSIGIIGAARSGLLVAKDPDNPDRRILASTKCNLAKLPPSLAFDLSPAANGALRVGWIGVSPHTAESLLAAPRDDEERGAVLEALEVLRTILSAGRVLAQDVKAQARKAGVAETTLKRAKAILGVRSQHEGFGRDGKWYWLLPSAADAGTAEDAREGQP